MVEMKTALLISCTNRSCSVFAATHPAAFTRTDTHVDPPANVIHHAAVSAATGQPRFVMDAQLATATVLQASAIHNVKSGKAPQLPLK